MDRATDLCAEDVVDEPMLRDAAQAGEGGGDDGGAESGLPPPVQSSTSAVLSGIAASMRRLISSVVGIGA